MSQHALISVQLLENKSHCGFITFECAFYYLVDTVEGPVFTVAQKGQTRLSLYGLYIFVLQACKGRQSAALPVDATNSTHVTLKSNEFKKLKFCF